MCVTVTVTVINLVVRVQHVATPTWTAATTTTATTAVTCEVTSTTTTALTLTSNIATPWAAWMPWGHRLLYHQLVRQVEIGVRQELILINFFMNQSSHLIELIRIVSSRCKHALIMFFWLLICLFDHHDDSTWFLKGIPLNGACWIWKWWADGSCTYRVSQKNISTL